MRRVNVITVRLPAGALSHEATNVAIERVEKAGGSVVQVLGTRLTSWDASRQRKTDDHFVTLLVETPGAAGGADG